jgi:hypothetical protein
MKRLLAIALLAFPLAAQTPTPTPSRTPTPTATRTPAPTATPTPAPAVPSRYSLATQVRPGFGTFSTESTVNLLGDTYYATDYRTFGRVAGNTTAVKNFWCQTGTGSVSAAPVWCLLASGDIPNNAANTTGSAAKWTTARNLAGNSVDGSAAVTFSNKFVVQGTADAGLSGPQFLGALATGILKNTITTGVLSIAAAADIPSLLTTKGDLGCFSTVPTALGIGTNTYVLTADSTQTCGFKWAAATGGGFSLTTKGDIHTFSTVDAALPVGTNGYVLSADSTQTTGLKWIATSSGGTVTSIATTAPITGGTITTTGTIAVSDFTASGVGHARGTVPDPGAGAGTTHYLREDATWAVPAGGGGGGTVAAKGDIQTYSTTPANLGVGTNGQVPMADSTAAVGLSYQWPAIGTLRTLKETVFAGITPASYTNGNTYTIDGSGYTCTIGGNGTSAIVAAGLQLRSGTTSGTGNGAIMQITHGATGDFNSIVGEARFRRGRWGFWTHRASYDFTNASGTAYARSQVGSTTAWLVTTGREKNMNGTPNTATGGNACDYYWNTSTPTAVCYPGVSTADVMLTYYRTPEIMDVYMGTWSSGWPTMESMTLIGTINMQAAGFVGTGGAPTATPVDFLFYVGGSSASSGTWEIVFDRWRITTWE